LGGGQLAHPEAVEDQQGWPGEFAQAAGPAVIGVSAGELGQDPAGGLGETDIRAVADGLTRRSRASGWSAARGRGPEVEAARTGSANRRLCNHRVAPQGGRVQL
jgi:hypothetical protein